MLGSSRLHGLRYEAKKKKMFGLYFRIPKPAVAIYILYILSIHTQRSTSDFTNRDYAQNKPY